jgi:hypothetical protein
MKLKKRPGPTGAVEPVKKIEDIVTTGLQRVYVLVTLNIIEI